MNSPSTYVALDGVGTNNTVPKGDTLYMRTQVPFKVRLTFADASVITNLPLQGLFILELDPANMLTLLEAEGAGQIEWFVSGPSA